MKYSYFDNWNDYKIFINRNFTIEDKFIVCGAGRSFKYMMELFPDTKIDYCLDVKHKDINFKEYKVYPYTYLEDKDISSLKFITTTTGEYTSEVKRTLLKFGARADNIISLVELYHFWGIRYKKQLLSTMASAILLTNCNLKCRNCFQLVPYVKKNVRFDFELVNEEIDLIFKTFSFVNNFIVSGGETFLYTDLDKVSTHIANNYTSCYGRLVMHTNGTLIPKNNVLESLRLLPRLTVTISDYTGQSEMLKGKQLLEKLDEYNINYELLCNFGRSDSEQWSEIGDPTVPKYSDTDEVRKRFAKCSIICNQVLNKKIYSCAAASMCELCRIRENGTSEPCVDLEKIQLLSFEEKADVIGKYFMGFIDNGYFEHCKYCYGIGSEINQRFAIPGEQE